MFRFASAALSILMLMSTALVPAACAAGADSEDKTSEKGFKFRKDPEISRIIPERPVQIKLKRMRDGNYSWDISGDSPEKVIEADEKLKRYVEGKK